MYKCTIIYRLDSLVTGRSSIMFRCLVTCHLYSQSNDYILCSILRFKVKTINRIILFNFNNINIPTGD